MDLNPHAGDWTYELADYCLSQNTDTLLLCNAWLDSGENDEEDTDLYTVKYWAARLRPLWDYNDSTNRDITVILCNRTGTEKGKWTQRRELLLLSTTLRVTDSTFAGSSTLFKMTSGLGQPVVLDALTKEEELLEVWNINV